MMSDRTPAQAVDDNMGLIMSISRECSNRFPSAQFEDMVQEGVVALLSSNAIARDVTAVRTGIRRYARRSARYHKRTRDMDAPSRMFGGKSAAEGAASTAKQWMDSDMYKLRDAMSSLSDVERLIVERVFVDESSLDSIGVEVGLSGQGVYDKCQAILVKLRKEMGCHRNPRTESRSERMNSKRKSAIEMHMNGRGAYSIANRLGSQLHTVVAWLKAAGVYVPMHNTPVSEKDRASRASAMRKMRESGATVTSIACEMGVTRQAASRALRRHAV